MVLSVSRARTRILSSRRSMRASGTTTTSRTSWAARSRSNSPIPPWPPRQTPRGSPAGWRSSSSICSSIARPATHRLPASTPTRAKYGAAKSCITPISTRTRRSPAASMPASIAATATSSSRPKPSRAEFQVLRPTSMTTR